MSGITEKLRHWSFYRQCLGKQGSSLTDVLRQVIAVYSAHPTAPLSFLPRVRSLKASDFFNLDKQGLAVRIPAMRLSVHMVPRDTARYVFSATVPTASDTVWEKRYSQKNRLIPADKYPIWKKRILEITDRPLTAREIKSAVEIPDQLNKMILNRMAFEGELLRTGSESLSSNIISYVATRSWIPGALERMEESAGLEWLAGSYLRAFGPARIKDFQWWAGITAGKAKEAVSHLDFVEVSNDYFLLSEDLPAFESFRIPSGDNVDLLPQWDCYTMGYAPDGRERLVSPDMQDQIYGNLGATGGNALGTVLINGLAHGSWKSLLKGTQMSITLKMFENISSSIQTKIQQQFEEIARLLNAGKLKFD